MFVEVEPASFIDVVRLNVAAIQRLKHDVGDGAGSASDWNNSSMLSNIESAAKDGAKHHQGNDKRLPCGLFL